VEVRVRNFWFVLAISSLPRLALAATPKKEAAKAGPAAMTVPATAPPIAESVAFLNAWLAANPSPDRPCRSLSAVELSPNGELVVTITRQSYCEDTKIVVPLEALDARSVVATAGDTAMLRATCDQSVSCARVWVKRKVRTGAGWAVRDADWISWGLPSSRTRPLPLRSRWAAAPRRSICCAARCSTSSSRPTRRRRCARR
jgi:hypothetical protein